MTKTRLVTPDAILSYPNLFTPRAMAEGMPEKYSCELIFPEGTDLTPLREAASAAAIQKWGDKLPANVRSPFRDGDEDRPGKPEDAGTTFISARSKQKPKVLEGEDMNPVMDEGEVYGGCVCRVSVTAFAYDQAGNKGVSFFLNNVWKLRDGEPLGGGVSAADEFAGAGVDKSAFGSDDTPF